MQAADVTWGGKVWVKWLDHSSESAWRGREEAKKVEDWECETLGWVIEETEKYLILASSRVVRCDQVSDTTAIIKGDILERRELRVRAKR